MVNFEAEIARTLRTLSSVYTVDMRLSVSLFGVALALLAAVFISVSNVWSGQFYRDGGNGESLLLVRYFVFVPFVWMLLRLRGAPLGLPRADARIVWITGACYAVGGGALTLAFGRLPVSLVVLILYLFPFVTLVAESLLFNRWPDARHIALMGIAFCGLVLALGFEDATLDPVGLVFAGLAALGVGLSFALTGRFLGHLDSLRLAFHMAVVALVLVVMLVAGTDSLSLPGTLAALGTLGIVVLSFSVAYVAMFAAVQHMGASGAATLMNLEPVVTLGLAALVLGEQLVVAQWMGAGLVVLAVVVFPLMPTRGTSTDSN